MSTRAAAWWAPVVVLVFVVAAGPSALAAPGGTPVPGHTKGAAMFLGDPAHTGSQPGPGPAREPVARWRFDAARAVCSTPAVADGAVYVGSTDGYLYALDAATGRERWRFGAQYGGAFSECGDAAPAVADGVVYLGDRSGTFYAVDAATGAERWRYEGGEEYESSPAVVDGVVYVGNADGGLYALDAAAGALRWRVTVGDEVCTSPVVVGGAVYVGGSVDPQGGVLLALGDPAG